MPVRHPWAVLSAAALAAGFAVVSLSLPQGFALSLFGDSIALCLLLALTAVTAYNAIKERGQTRVFWWLISAGAALWTFNQALWWVYEIVLHRELPDPFFGDVILFIHLVPFMAAFALRPHRPQEEQKLYFSTLNFVMLLLWWVFLYAFVVFPDEYVLMNVPVFSRNYDLLYLIENLLLVGALIALAARSRGDWKPIYWNFLLGSALYTVASESMNAAISRGRYFTGSLYDVPFILGVYWMIWTAVLARRLRPACEPVTAESGRWLKMAPRLAMLPVLSLPLMAFWTLLFDAAVPQLRQFRLLITLGAMLVLSFFVFVRQYLQDRELVRLLQASHRGFENLQRLQTELVQKEKLASLGQLVAGAAHEINNPLAAILGYSELLTASGKLASDQESMARKIGQQARRTRDLVAGLLSFAQQTPAEKTRVDIGLVVQRVLQMEALRLENKHIKVQTYIAPNLAGIWGNSNQLFQCCVHIVNNAMDAMDEVHGGALDVTVQNDSGQVVVTFADSGPGIKDPKRVFDPFYTTKAIGKGTGLGLSATYGVVQDHKGQIKCFNKPEGGAVFVMQFPVAAAARGAALTGAIA